MARNILKTLDMYNKKILEDRIKLIAEIKALVPKADEDELLEWAKVKGNSGLSEILAAAKLIDLIC